MGECMEQPTGNGFARFYGPLALLLVALAFAPLYARVAVNDYGVRMTWPEVTLWSLSAPVANIGGLILAVLIGLLVTATFRTLPQGVLITMAVLAFGLGLALACRLGRATDVAVLAATGRIGLALLFCTALLATIHAIVGPYSPPGGDPIFPGGAAGSDS